MSGGGSRILHRQEYTAGGRGTSTGGSRTHTGRNIPEETAEHKEEQEKQMKALEKTYLYMQHYREIGQFVDDLKANKERNIDEKDMETVIIFDSINRALKRIQEDAMTAGYVYKYNAFVMHYIDGIPYESIRMILNCGKNTPKKWSDKIMKMLSIKIFGIRGIENETV